MDKNTKFATIVKYVKGKIEYDELQDALTGSNNLNRFDREYYNRYVQEIFSCFEDAEFYQYLTDENCLIETLQNFIEAIQWHLNEWNYEVASAAKEKILNAMATIDDENKFKILSLREEDEYRDYNTIYNPITERFDKEFLAAFIISLSEEERIKFLLDSKTNALNLARLENREIVKIFNSLSEKNKLRIFTDFTEIKYEYEGEIVTDRYIPLVHNASRAIVFCKYDSLLAELIGDNLDYQSQIEVLKNSSHQYDYALRMINYEIKEIIRGLKEVDDETIKIINTYFLHESDKEKLDFIGDNLKRLKGINDDILETVKFELLTTKYQELAPILDVITCYPEIQQQILNLNEVQYRVLIASLDMIQQDEVKDWIPIFENIINGLNSKKYAELIGNLEDEAITDEETIRKLIYIISGSENIFEIHSIEELKEFDRVAYCEKIKNGELRTEYINGLTELDKLKLCVLEKKYGQSLEESKRLLTRYGKDLDKFEIQDENDMKIKAYLEAIRNILTTNDKSVLEELYAGSEVLEENYLFSNIIESKIRGFFVKQYNRELYQIDKERKIEIDIPSASNLEIYDSGEKFKLVITSLGAYSEYNSDTNFEQEWNRKQFDSHGFCASLVANNSIATARIKHLVLGFNNFTINSLLLSAPWDIRIN